MQQGKFGLFPKHHFYFVVRGNNPRFWHGICNTFSCLQLLLVMIACYHFIVGFCGFTLLWMSLSFHYKTSISENNFSVFRWLGYFGAFQGIIHWQALVYFYYHNNTGTWWHYLPYLAEYIALLCLIEAARLKFNSNGNRHLPWWIPAAPAVLLPLTLLANAPFQTTLLQILGASSGLAMLLSILSAKRNWTNDNISTNRSLIDNALIAISLLVLFSYPSQGFLEQIPLNSIRLLQL